MFTALDHCQEAIEITSEDHVVQVWRKKKVKHFVEFEDRNPKEIFSQ